MGLKHPVRLSFCGTVESSSAENILETLGYILITVTQSLKNNSLGAFYKIKVEHKIENFNLKENF